ncbi:MAG: DUF2497 domain-containing protein [Alphaproteobacteria bacterium]|nr:DUF2497 domain-containing protein [Alphaproteobacteria bacterium]OJV12513.1 MAG: hypothetical protein BGO27_07260 [Alphaproteobacteria bacterium 33-17]
MTDNPKDNMQDILSNIRDVISGNNEEVLELVDEVDQNGNPVAKTDVLKQIDETLGKTEAAPAADANTPSAQVENTDIAKAEQLAQTAQNSAPNIAAAPETPVASVAEPIAPADAVKTDTAADAANTIENIAKATPQIVAEAAAQAIEMEAEAQNKETTKSLLSEQVIEESSKHFKELLKAVARPHDNFGLRSGVTVEDLVVESLKPQLSSWLEKNLPVLVRELVEKEIKRLIPHDE